MRGVTGRRAAGGWFISALLAVAAASLITDTLQSAAIIAIALTGTALGTITPILRDAGLNRGRLGSTISAAGAVGEFAPLVAISVFLSGRQPMVGVLTLLLFLGVAALAFLAAAKGQRQWLQRMVSATLHTSGQFAIRFVICLMAALVALAVALGVDFLLGAFTATTLPLVIAITKIGTDAGVLDEHIAAALVGAGMLSVLLFPMLALIGRKRRASSELGQVDSESQIEPVAAHE